MSPLSLFSEDKLRGRRAKVEKILVKGFCQQCFPSLRLCHRFLLLQSKESAPTNWIFVRKQREARGGVKKREMDGVTSRQSRGQRWKEGVHSWMDGWMGTRNRAKEKCVNVKSTVARTVVFGHVT